MNHRLLVIDASVAVKWYLPEPNQELADALRARSEEGVISLAAPELLTIEVASAVWKRARRSQLDIHRALEIVQDLQRTPLRWRSTRELVEPATRIALQWGCTVYDAMYLALAEAHDTQVVTADRRLAEAMPEDWGAQRVTLLNEFAD